MTHTTAHMGGSVYPQNLWPIVECAWCSLTIRRGHKCARRDLNLANNA